MLRGTTVAEFLAGYPANIRRIARGIRTIIKNSIPDYSEAVYPGWKLIGHRVRNGKRSSYFGYILPMEDCVMLGFEYGHLLSDPEHLLEGSGKQVRHIRIRNLNELNQARISSYVVEAAMLALHRGKA
jgi:hypothetical protein